MKKALVTGASSGIGEAISRMLLEKGYEVYGIGRDFAKCSLKEGEGPMGEKASGSFHPVICDLSDRKALTGCVNEINKAHDLDLFVSNAGVGYYGLHEELDPEKIHELVAVNLEAPMILSNLLMRDMKKNEGTFVFISSVTAAEVNPHGCAYGATKAGLSSFAHSLFAEARKYGVRVITIQPDMTRTALYRNADFTCAEEEGTYLSPEDVAEAVGTALATDQGRLYTDMTLVPQFHRIQKKGQKPAGN